MSIAAATPCRHPGCGALVRGGGRCDKHRAAVSRETDARRGTAASRGYGSAWAKARAGFLRSHPLCAEHARKSVTVAATVVDHVIPHRGDRALFWDRDNWQPLCKRCHDVKTATVDRAAAAC